MEPGLVLRFRSALSSAWGRLTVQSSPGAGSTFSFRLALPAAGEQHAANVPLPALAGADVLIVAPTEASASLIARQLTDWGARTCLLGDEQSARSLLSERPWSAVLVDFAMGRHACEQLIRAACAIERRIVLLTPAERDEIATLRQAGFSGYLIKPVRRDSLAMQILEEAGSVDEAYQHPRAPAPAATSDAAKRRLAVLVAEDNEINALLVHSLLTRLGHRPTIVRSGQAAFDACSGAQAAGTPYDLLLMDLHMPEGDGIETVRRIRAMEAERDRPPLAIFALTASAYDEDRTAKPCRRDGRFPGQAARAPDAGRPSRPGGCRKLACGVNRLTACGARPVRPGDYRLSSG